MKMLIDLCLPLVAVAQRDNEIADSLSMCYAMHTLCKWVRDACICARG